MNEAARAAWSAFQKETGVAADPVDVFAFGDSPDLADSLLALVLSGEKRATCGRKRAYDLEGLDPPRPGDLSLVLDGAGRPRAVIETVDARIAPFASATAAFANEEGEGDKSLEWWRAAHIAFFQRECAKEGVAFDESEDVVFERFRLVWTAPAD
ncbi:MAG: ASCH domain-containing protein [Pseudomonadota bacterium]